jgi:hypothetical protein
MSHTHHSNADVYERIQRDDMMQAAAILARGHSVPGLVPALLQMVGTLASPEIGAEA